MTNAMFVCENFRNKTRLLLSAIPILLPVAAPSAAWAQTAPSTEEPASEAQSTPEADIVITGTRVTRDGYNAPTPVSVVSADEIQRSATPNVADYVNTLPALALSATPQSAAGLNVGGRQGVNSLNLRGLGDVRTLVLLNGQRVGSAISTGVVDVTEFPQQLISRVDVVTGGASSAYGSDALSGVVNFVLNTHYTGIKGEVSGGATTYGDNGNWKVNLTLGTPFAGGRGHFLLSGEATYEDGILINDRKWNQEGNGFVNNPAYKAGSGLPQILYLPQVGLSNAPLGGEIACSATSACAPLRGIAFGQGGTPYNVVFGSVVSDPLMSGGSWQGNAYIRDKKGASLLPRQARQNVFSRLSFDISDNWNVYGQLSFSHARYRSLIAASLFPGNLTIKTDNAFLPKDIADRATALGVTSLPFGTMNGDLPTRGSLINRWQQRYVAGIDGKFDAFGTKWTLEPTFPK